MEITFVISVEKEKENHNDCFQKAYKHARMRYKNIYPVVKFTLVNIEFL